MEPKQQDTEKPAGAVEFKEETQTDVGAEPSHLDNISAEPMPEQGAAIPPKKAARRKQILWGSVAFVLLAAVGIGGYIFGHQSSDSDTKNAAVTKTDTPTEKVSETALAQDPQLEKFIHPTTGETWYSTPKTISRQGWLNSEYRETYVVPGVSEADITATYESLLPDYYEVGTRAGNTIFMAKQKAEIGTPFATFFERSNAGAVSAIAKPSATATYDDYYLPSFKESLKLDKINSVDESIHYDSLSLPDSIALKNKESVTSTKTPWYPFGSAVKVEGRTETVVMKLGTNTLYRVEKQYADTKLTNIGYFVRTVMGPELALDYQPNTPSLEKYSFDNGKVATYIDNGQTKYDAIHGIAKGCGGTTAAVTRTDSLTTADIVQVGKTDAGKPVYTLKSQGAALLAKAYDEYKQTISSPVSLSSFVEAHGLLIIKNADDELLVYVRDQYGPVGGCAKPVVYLYPTKAQSVSVRVGADVTVSDPLYPKDGWQQVWAEPNGRLTYQGSEYASLFWEGQGYGEYPAITSGTVVKRADAAKTIRKQLATQSLNTIEIQDFMAFWEAKIPQKPYIRLTWFNTQQMNALAPLSVTPRPQTVIRVFLDMDGFDAPISLPKQKLSPTERKGFTVVEWGGLTHLAPSSRQ